MIANLPKLSPSQHQIPKRSSISSSSISDTFLLLFPSAAPPLAVIDLPVVALVTAGEGLLVVTTDEVELAIVECLCDDDDE